MQAVVKPTMPVVSMLFTAFLSPELLAGLCCLSQRATCSAAPPPTSQSPRAGPSLGSLSYT